MVLQNHRLCRRTAGSDRNTGPLAGQGPADADQLDQPVRGRQGPVRDRRPGRQARGLHDPARHLVRRLVLRPIAKPPAVAVARREQSGSGGVPGRMRQARHQRGGPGESGKTGLRYRLDGRASVPAGPRTADLRRQFRADGIRRGGDFRLPRPRRARSGIRPQIRPRRHCGRVSAGRRSGDFRDWRRGLYRRRRDDEFGIPRRSQCADRDPQGDGAAGGDGVGRGHGQLPLARLGRLEATLLGLSRTDHPLRGLRHGSRARGKFTGHLAGGRRLRRLGQSARPASDLEACRLPHLRQAGKPRDRYVRHLRRIVLVFRAFLLACRGHRLRPQRRGLLDAGRPVYRRRGTCGAAPALRPFLHPRAARLRLSRYRRTVRRPVHPGHGLSRNLSDRGWRLGLPE